MDCMQQLSGHEDSATRKANKARDLSRQVQIQLSSCSGSSYPLTTYGCIRVGKHTQQGRREIPGRHFAAIDVRCISCTMSSPKAWHLGYLDSCSCVWKETSSSREDFITPLLTFVLQWGEKPSFSQWLAWTRNLIFFRQVTVQDLDPTLSTYMCPVKEVRTTDISSLLLAILLDLRPTSLSHISHLASPSQATLKALLLGKTTMLLQLHYIQYLFLNPQQFLLAVRMCTCYLPQPDTTVVCWKVPLTVISVDDPCVLQ